MDAVARIDWLGKINSDPRTGCGDLSVAVVLASHHNSTTGRCDPSVNKIAETSGLTTRSVRRSILSLEKAGYLALTRTRGGRQNDTNKYLIKRPTPDTRVTPDTHDPGHPCHPTPDTRVRPPLTRVSPEQGKEQGKEQGTPYSPPSATSSMKPAKPKRKNGSRFSKPAVEEISAYCKQRGNAVDPQRFWDYYESKGWLVGKAPMKCWRSAVRTWERSDTKKPGGRTAEKSDSLEDWFKNRGDNFIDAEFIEISS